MKHLVIIILLFSASHLYAGINLDFNPGGWVCYASGMEKYPSLARGKTKKRAQNRALKKCSQFEGSSLFCKVKECGKSNFSGKPSFSLRETDSGLSITLSDGKAAFYCSLEESFGDIYEAEAHSEVEAKALVAQACYEAEGSGLFCKIARADCEKISGTTVGIGDDGTIDLGGLLGNTALKLFN